MVFFVVKIAYLIHKNLNHGLVKNANGKLFNGMKSNASIVKLTIQNILAIIYNIMGGNMKKRKKFKLNKGGFFQSMASRKSEMAKKHANSVKARKKGLKKTSK